MKLRVLRELRGEDFLTGSQDTVKQSQRQSGFTFVEIMVVVVIILILTTGIITVGMYVRKNAQKDETRNYITILVSALQEYKNHYEASFNDPPINNEFPTNLEELDHVPKCRKILDKIPSDKKEDLLPDGSPNGIIDTVYDAWDLPIKIIPNGAGNFPTIRSAGPDKEFNNADDITSDKL